MSVDHYENFPVASVLCPPRLRPAVAAIYGFARTADDLADEGDASPDARLTDLAAFRADLDSVAAGLEPSARWKHVFDALGIALRSHCLPVPLLNDLLSAFSQDVVQQRYRDRPELLDYCRRSANPIGRLLLHLYGVTDADSLRRSDAICTALQLINFWQDLRVDAERGRIYVPAADSDRHGVPEQQFMRCDDDASMRALVADMVAWARGLMRSGAPLVHRVPGRAGWELRLVVQGGLRILEKIERIDHATMLHRPTIGRQDAPALLWRAWRMNAVPSAIAGAPA